MEHSFDKLEQHDEYIIGSSSISSSISGLMKTPERWDVVLNDSKSFLHLLIIQGTDSVRNHLLLRVCDMAFLGLAALDFCVSLELF